MVVLHPRGSELHYDASGQVFLASVGHQPLSNLKISDTMARHLQGTRVLEHGGDHGADSPTENELATALIVNHTPRIAGSLPRAVRLFEDEPPSALHCDWTQTEWYDFEKEVNQIRTALTGNSAWTSEAQNHHLLHTRKHREHQ